MWAMLVPFSSLLLLPLWQGLQVRRGLLDSWTLMDGLGWVYALLCRAGGFLLLLSSRLHFWAPFHSDFVPTFFFLRGDVVSLLPRAESQGYPLLGSTLAHCSYPPSWLSVSPDFPQELFAGVPVSCASALPVVPCGCSGPSAEEALLFAVVQSTPR